jgi:hypothetical protein
MSLISNQ